VHKASDAYGDKLSISRDAVQIEKRVGNVILPSYSFKLQKMCSFHLTVEKSVIFEELAKKISQNVATPKGVNLIDSTMF